MDGCFWIDYFLGKGPIDDGNVMGFWDRHNRDRHRRNHVGSGTEIWYCAKPGDFCDLCTMVVGLLCDCYLVVMSTKPVQRYSHIGIIQL